MVPGNVIYQTHTLGHRDCPACLRGKAEMEIDLGPLPFPLAAEIWFETRRPFLLPKTVECNLGYIRALSKFFLEVALKDMHPGMLRMYQVERSLTAGPSAINHELNLLARVLRRAGLWNAMRDYYHPMREPAWKPPRVFDEAEEQRIFAFAERDPNLRLAKQVFTITRNTSASGSELRMLRLRHIKLNIYPPRVEIPPEAAKNTSRPRMIPLNEEAIAAFRDMILRAGELGSFLPDHFLFPFRIKPNYFDPTRPASKSWLRKQTVQLRERSQVPHLNPHAWRHQFVTRALESGMDEHHVIKLAGWRSEKMLARYGHARIEKQYQAVQILSKKPVAKVNIEGYCDERGEAIHGRRGSGVRKGIN
jgi:integrase